MRCCLRLFAVWLLVSGGGCTLTLEGHSTRSGRPDGSTPDAAAGPDAGRGDAGSLRSDAAMIDAGAPDAGRRDAGTDAGPPTIDAGPRVPCATSYGGTSGYRECGQTIERCQFFRSSSSTRSCNQVCEAGGGVCNGAHSNVPTQQCDEFFGISCSLPAFVSICTCSRNTP